MNIKINPEISVGKIETRNIRVAILDLYNNEPNEGMRCIQQLLNDFPLLPHQSLTWKIFDVRFRQEVPAMDYDIYISTGGPGSPMEEPGARWEKLYFNWMDELLMYNRNTESDKKHALFICHSFQLLCRRLKAGNVCKRHSAAFGVFTVNKTESGKKEPLFQSLNDPFYIVDSREWQVIEPDMKQLNALGAKILAIEKERPHVSYERAVMAIRFSEEIVGVQFHPEADAIGMQHYLMLPAKKEQVIATHGIEKYNEMFELLNHPEKILKTQQVIVPSFLRNAIDNTRQLQKAG